MTQWRKFAFLKALVAALIAGDAAFAAEPASKSNVAMFATSYQLSGVDKRPPCTITLKTTPVTQGFALSLPADCRNRFGLQSVTAWRPLRDEGVVLYSEGGAPIVTFQEQEAGIWSSAAPLTLFLRND